MQRILSISALALAGIFYAGAETIEVLPGSLADAIPSLKGASEIILTGKADVRDLSMLRDLEVAPDATLDLSQLSVAELNSENPAYLGKSYFKENFFPSYVLFKSRFNKVILPKGVKILEAGALAGSEISEITIPEGVTSIGDYAFYGCKRLTTVNLPNSLVSIGKGAFSNCPSLKSVNLENSSVSAIPASCFAGDAALTSLNLESIMSVGSEAFSGTSIKSVVLPQATYLAPYALADMPSLREAIINNEAEVSEGTLMNNASLVALEGVPEHIPALFAANCTQYIPAEIITEASTIGEYAFAGTPVSDIVLGSGLTTVDAGAFKNAAALNHIDATALESSVPEADTSAFAEINPAEVRLKVADNTEAAWREHPVWGLFDIYTSQSTGINDITADTSTADAISVTLNGNILRVNAPEAIESVGVHDLSGALLLSLPAGDTVSEADVTSLLSGVLIVSVKAGKARKGVKIIL